MDKRSVLAIVATFLVLILWQVFYIAPKQRETTRKRMIQLRERAVADSLAALDAEDEETPVEEAEPDRPPVEVIEPAEAGEAPGAPELEPDVVEIRVSTGKMVVVLSSRGGDVTSVKLLEFEGLGAEPVELVPEGGGGFALALKAEGEWRSLSDKAFETVIRGEKVTENRELYVGDVDEDVSVVFRRVSQGGARMEKRYTFGWDRYEIGLSVAIAREGELQETGAFAVSWDCGMAVTEENIKGDRREFAALGKLGEEFYKESLGKFNKVEEKGHEGMVVWAGARTKYFLSAVIPERQRSGTIVMRGNSTSGFIGYTISYPFRGDPRLTEESFTCYVGPLDMETLKGYGVGLEKTIELGKLRFLSVIVLNFMTFLKRFIPNYGLIIIILSVLTKVLFYRLTHKSFKSMKDMQRLQPKIKELQEKHKDNKQKMNEEMMKLYKEAGVNPLGGCLPLLLQMPVFIALFNVLRNTIELRNAPFFLWIDDLSSPDTLFRFGFSLPFIGNEFHLLPILMGAAMVLQSKMGASPTGEATPAAQTKMMSTMMPIIFTVLFYGMPSGLVLYWFVNNILTIVQQYYVHKQVDDEEVGSIHENDVGKKDGKEKDAGSAGRAMKSKRGGGAHARKSKSKRRSYH
jgi:YidC/Oxa1 family membrane protein insertase